MNTGSNGALWRSQMARSIRTLERLEEFIALTDEERAGVRRASERFTWSITPYYAGLMDREDRACPIRLQAVPAAEELEDEESLEDPLEEGAHAPADHVIRVYPDRVAFCVGATCPVYCRHCLRKETSVGREDNFSDEALAPGVAYLRAHPEIRDVLLTGGDPLLMPDERLDALLGRLRAIPSVEALRIGSRAPCTLPQRVTPELCAMLRRHHPLYLNTQFNHPKEITPEAERACAMLADAGIPLGNQSVLLRGVNDDAETMKRLCRELMRIRVRPYYLYQAQILRGTRHFRTTIEEGMEIHAALQGHTSGLATPKYLLDTPYGKTPLNRSYVLGRDGDDVVMRTWNGELWREPNPADTPAAREAVRRVALPKPPEE